MRTPDSMAKVFVGFIVTLAGTSPAKNESPAVGAGPAGLALQPLFAAVAAVAVAAVAAVAVAAVAVVAAAPEPEPPPFEPQPAASAKDNAMRGTSFIRA